MGNLDSKRDWGHAKDYVEGMWKILQHDTPEDFVLATGVVHSVKDFVELAFQNIDIKIIWEGSNLDKKGIDENTGKTLVKIDPRYFRPTEVDLLKGDPTKAKTKLNWVAKTSFSQLVSEMVKSDVNAINNK